MVGERKLVGEVAHFFDRISVAVIKLSANLKEGETIRFEDAQGNGFEQGANSMQIDRKAIKEAKKGESIGLKTERPVREGFKVYKVE